MPRLLLAANITLIVLLGLIPVSGQSDQKIMGWSVEFFTDSPINKIYRGPNCEIAEARNNNGYLLHSIYKWGTGDSLNERVAIVLTPNGRFKNFRRILYEITANGKMSATALDYDYNLFRFNCGDRIPLLPKKLREILKEYHDLRDAVPPLVDKYGVPYI